MTEKKKKDLLPDYKLKQEKFAGIIKAATYDKYVEIINDLKNTVCLLSDKLVEKTEETYLVNEYLPSLIRSLMNQKIIGAQEIFCKIYVFLCCWIRARINFLDQMNAGDAKVLARLFNDSSKLFDTSSINYVGTIYLFNALKELDKELELNLNYLNSYFLRNIEIILIPLITLFNKHKGFEKLRKAIESLKSVDSFPILRRWLKAIMYIMKYSTKESFRNEISKVFESFIKYFVSLNIDQIIKIDDKEISKVLKYLKIIINKSEIYKIDLISLCQIGMGLFVIENIKKQLFGIDLMVTALNKILNGLYHSDDKMNAFIDLLDRNNFFKLLISRKLQPEIVSRAKPLITVFYILRHIELKEIENLWKGMLDNKDQPLKKMMSEILECMAANFCERDAVHLLGKIKELNLKEYDESIIHLLTILANNEYNKNKQLEENQRYALKVIDSEKEPDTQTYLYLEYLWELTNAEALDKGFPPKIQAKLIDNFINLLLKFYTSKISEYLSKCEKQMLLNLSFFQASKIYMKVIEGSPSSSKQLSGNELFSCVLLSLLKLKQTITQSAIDSKKVLSMVSDIIQPEYLAASCYYSELEQRLNFIAFLINSLRVQPNVKHMRIIVEAFLTHAFSMKEIDTVFKFLERIICSNQGSILITKGVFDEFWYEILLKHNAKEYSETEVKCYIKIFSVINSTYHNLNVRSSDLAEIVSNKVIGLKHMWDIALYCNNSAAQHMCKNYLNNLYSNFSSDVSLEIKSSMIKEFAEKCMTCLKPSAVKDKSADPEVIKETVSVLDLLYTCVRKLKTVPEDELDYNFEITFQWMKLRTASLPVTPETTLIEALQTASILLELTMLQLESLRFTCGEKELLPTAETLAQYGIVSPVLINVGYQSFHSGVTTMQTGIGLDDMNESASQLLDIFPSINLDVIKAALKRAENNTDQAVTLLTNDTIRQQLEDEVKVSSFSPAKKASENVAFENIFAKNSAYFKIIYELLDTNINDIGEKASSVLSIIQANEEVQNIIQSLKSSEDLEKLFLLISPYKARYIIKLIGNSIAENNAMLMSFVANDGIAALINICMKSCKAKVSDEQNEVHKRELNELMILTVRKFVELLFKTSTPKVYEEYIKLHDSRSAIEGKLSNQIQTILEKAISMKLVYQLLALLNEALTGNMVEELIKIFHMIPLINIDLLKAIHSTEYGETIIKAIMMYGNNNSINSFLKEINIMLGLLKVPDNDPAKVFYVNLVLPILLNSNKTLDGQFFTALKVLLKLYSLRVMPEGLKYTKSDVLRQLFKPVLDYNAEGFLNANGSLMIICELLDKDKLKEFEPDLVKSILNYCYNEIFGFTSAESRPSRQDADTSLSYLLIIMERVIENYPKENSELQAIIMRFHSELAKSITSDKSSLDVKRNYVGLQNLGSTCYINALFQQLFMIPTFRQKLVKINSQRIDDCRDSDRVIPNLKAIFAELLGNSENSCSPKRFCKEFRGFNNAPINVIQQQDVDEFFNHLADRIENELSVLGEDQILKEEIEIKVGYEITSLESKYPYNSTAVETFLTLPLTIKDCNSIEEGLNAFVKEEILDGETKYYCEKYDRPIKATKKSFIKGLSQTMVITLKRFEFNRNMMRRVKLNDYCEFPKEINLYKWTQEGQSGLANELRNEFSYDLVGVIVHSGCLEAGHYYSFIKERNPDSKNFGRWFEFNDERVTSFDFSRMRNVAYGYSKSNPMSLTSTNAYYLFYERKYTESVFMSDTEIVPEFVINTRTYFTNSYMNFFCHYIAKFEHTAIESFDLTLSHPEADIPDSSFKMWKLAFDYMLDLTTRKSAGSNVSVILEGIHAEAKVNALFCLWLIKHCKARKESYFMLLMYEKAENIREVTYMILFTALIATFKLELPNLEKTIKAKKEIHLAASARFLKTLLGSGIKKAKENWKSFDELFKVLVNFCDFGPEQARVLVKKKLIGKLVTFITGEAGFSKKNDDFTTEKPKFTVPIELLSHVVRSCSTEVMRAQQKAPQTALFPLTDLSELPEDEISSLLAGKDSNCLKKLNHNSNEWLSLFLHIAWKDYNRTAKIAANIANKIYQAYYSSECFPPCLQGLLSTLLKSDDKQMAKVAFKSLLEAGMINILSRNAREDQFSFYISQHVIQFKLFNDLINEGNKAMEEVVEEKCQELSEIVEILLMDNYITFYDKKRSVRKFCKILSRFTKSDMDKLKSVKMDDDITIGRNIARINEDYEEDEKLFRSGNQGINRIPEVCPRPLAKRQNIHMMTISKAEKDRMNAEAKEKAEVNRNAKKRKSPSDDWSDDSNDSPKRRK